MSLIDESEGHRNNQQKTIISWNVNSVKVRLEQISALIKEHKPDVVALQEIKCTEEDFPTEQIEQLGYRAIVCGQKQYHGVAILHKDEYAAKDVKLALPGCDLEEARYVEVLIEGMRISNVYVPNGYDIHSQSYVNKLRFLNALCFTVHERMYEEDIWVIAGDFNVIPRLTDTGDKSFGWEETGMASPAVRKFWFRLINQGWLDAGERDRQMTWQDYKNPNTKLRIDHALLSPGAADSLVEISVLSEWRRQERPSDHMPVKLVLDLSRPRLLLSKWRWNSPVKDTLLGVRDLRQYKEGEEPKVLGYRGCKGPKACDVVHQSKLAKAASKKVKQLKQPKASKLPKPAKSSSTRLKNSGMLKSFRKPSEVRALRKIGKPAASRHVSEM